ncbi:MAG: hypothetical protein AAFS07_08965 [Pseudomonadota bacterium]
MKVLRFGDASIDLLSADGAVLASAPIGELGQPEGIEGLRTAAGAEGAEDAPPKVVLWLPEDQVALTRPRLPKARRERAIGAIAAAMAKTGEPAQELAIAIVPAFDSKGRSRVFVAYAQTVREACAYATGWGFEPVRVGNAAMSAAPSGNLLTLVPIGKSAEGAVPAPAVPVVGADTAGEAGGTKRADRLAQDPEAESPKTAPLEPTAAGGAGGRPTPRMDDFPQGLPAAVRGRHAAAPTAATSQARAPAAPRRRWGRTVLVAALLMGGAAAALPFLQQALKPLPQEIALAVPAPPWVPAALTAVTTEASRAPNTAIVVPLADPQRQEAPLQVAATGTPAPGDKPSAPLRPEFVEQEDPSGEIVAATTPEVAVDEVEAAAPPVIEVDALGPTTAPEPSFVALVAAAVPEVSGPWTLPLRPTPAALTPATPTLAPEAALAVPPMDAEPDAEPPEADATAPLDESASEANAVEESAVDDKLALEEDLTPTDLAPETVANLPPARPLPAVEPAEDTGEEAVAVEEEATPAPEAAGAFAADAAPVPKIRPDPPSEIAPSQVAAPPPRAAVTSTARLQDTLRAGLDAGVEPMGAAGSAVDDAMLIGVLELDGQRQALLRLGNGTYHRVGIGDTVADWRIDDIAEESVSLSFDGETRVYPLLSP